VSRKIAGSQENQETKEQKILWRLHIGLLGRLCT
jgi:hypothetical protein